MKLFGLLLAVGVATASVRGAEPGTTSLADLLAGYEKLRLSPPSSPVTNFRLATGHLECVLVSGGAAYVKAGDQIAGIYLEGTGTMEYLSVDPIEAPVVAFVSKKSSSLSPEKTERGLRFRQKFTRLLWLAAGEPLPPIPGGAGTAATAGFDAERAKFGRRRGPPTGFGFARERFNAPGAPYVWVEIEGADQDALYVHDGMENPHERFGVLREIESQEKQFKDALFELTLSRQPLGRDRRDPPQPRFLLTDVDLELKASDGKDVSMTVVETLVPQKDPLGVVPFDLDSSLYDTFGAHLTTRNERVRRVSDEAGRTLAYRHENGRLLVQLAEQAPPDRPVKLRFEIDGDFLVHPGGSSFWELGIWNWFPQPKLCEQHYTFHAVVRVRKPYVPFAPGATVRRAVEGEDNVLEVRVDTPIQFAIVMAGDYSFKEETRDGVTIRVGTYALRNERAIKQLTGLAAAIIGFYTEFLGPFPFPEFNILEIDDYGFGQAPPGTMFITKEAFNPLGGTVENQLYSGGVNERFAHEIAHQYWGYVVSPPSEEEDWLSESFAEYCAALFMKAGKGEPTYKSIVGHWRGDARFAADRAPIPLANRVYVAHDATTQFAIRTGLLYNKGPLLLYALHRELGDQTFLTFLKSYQKSFRWKFGSTKTVAGLLQFLTKKDYTPFFEENYWGLGMPKDSPTQ